MQQPRLRRGVRRALAPACRRRRTARRPRRSGLRWTVAAPATSAPSRCSGCPCRAPSAASASAARKALSAAPGLSARLARVPAAISASNWPMSPELNAFAARRLASSASAPELGGDRIRARDAGQHADRALHDLRRRQHAIGVPDRAAHQGDHRDMRPAADRLGALHAVRRAGRRGSWWQPAARSGTALSMPARHGLAVASCASSPAVAGAARAHPRAGLLPGAAEHIGALPGLDLTGCSPRPPSSCRSPPATRAWRSFCVAFTYASGGGVWQAKHSSGASSDSRRNGAVARMISSPGRRQWAAADRPGRPG